MKPLLFLTTTAMMFMVGCKEVKRKVIPKMDNMVNKVIHDTIYIDTNLYCLIGYIKMTEDGASSYGTYTMSFVKPPTDKDILKNIQKKEGNKFMYHLGVISLSYFKSKKEFDNYYK